MSEHGDYRAPHRRRGRSSRRTSPSSTGLPQDARAAELAEAVRAAQHEGDSDPPADTSDSSLAQAEVAWRTALEQSVEEESARADRAEAEVARLSAELAESAAEIARLAAVPASALASAEPHEIVQFARKRRASALLTVLAGLGALIGAGVVVAMALDGRLLTPVGIAASVVSGVLALASALSRTRSATVWIDRGTVHIEGPAGHHQFDLTSENTRLQMVGEPGRRGWRVEFLRRAMSPFVVDGTMVDAHAFVDAVRRWRPDL
jgi:hypothetical protein